MVTVNKKSAAAIAGILLLMQSPMPAWAQDAADEVQNVPTQTEETAKASTEDKVQKAENLVSELKVKIETKKQELEEVEKTLKTNIENINTLTEGIKAKNNEIEELKKAANIDRYSAENALKALKPQEKEKKQFLMG